MENNLKNKINQQWEDMKNDAVALQVHSSGRSRPLSSPDDRFIYCSAFDNFDVSLVTGGGLIILEPIEKFLLEDGWYKYRSHKHQLFNDTRSLDNAFDTFQIWLKDGGFMINFSIASGSKGYKDRSVVESYLSSSQTTINNPDTPCVIENFELYYPAVETNNISTKAYLDYIMSKFRDNYYVESKASKIGIISHDRSDYYVKNFSLSGKVPEFIHVDEHYGDGFNDFHDKMVERIKKESKGLVLFHGDPGTGKTQYIRMLLDVLTRSKKSILYVPPSFSSQLTEPQMIEFISDWVLDEDQDCILLIEDAEPLLEVRNGSDGRSTGISNLLNMTDGILNDMLGLMVIATFNTPISKIDSALLRAGRLIARKEFHKLSEKQARKLADALKVDLPLIEYPASLAEFYSDTKGADILVHTIKPDTKIGFK